MREKSSLCTTGTLRKTTMLQTRQKRMIAPHTPKLNAVLSCRANTISSRRFLSTLHRLLRGTFNVLRGRRRVRPLTDRISAAVRTRRACRLRIPGLGTWAVVRQARNVQERLGLAGRDTLPVRLLLEGGAVSLASSVSMGVVSA